jgi:hypothetical protein
MLRKVNMGDVAMFVASSLNFPPPSIDGSRPISTIRVNQFKTKFEEVRIYCDLACPSLVRSTWTFLGNEGEPTQQFIQNRMRWDARHYRDCYLSMVRILSNIPDGEQFISSLVNGADHRELLYENKNELNDAIIQSIEKRKELYFYEKWSASNSDELLKTLTDFCGFNGGLFESL